MDRDRRVARAPGHGPRRPLAPIVGAPKVGLLEDALAAAGLTLSDAATDGLEEPRVPPPVLGHG